MYLPRDVPLADLNCPTNLGGTSRETVGRAVVRHGPDCLCGHFTPRHELEIRFSLVRRTERSRPEVYRWNIQPSTFQV